ncbi:hypothetical protein [Sphingomonas sp.]|jgi:oligosaccharide repeat unit polymerase|uniref:hypothetical protein n=1 Tax=Sphingomonas sp. TaxID=28214 RepID=UPI0035625977
MSDLGIIWSLPDGYWLALAVLAALVFEAGLRWREKWAAPALMIYATVLGWYMLEPIESVDMMNTFSADEISTSFVAVMIFLIAFRFMATLFYSMMTPKKINKIESDNLPADSILKYIIFFWLTLLSIGIFRLNGDIITALFPVEARNGNSMWLRAAGADAGSLGFAVSLAGYFYILVLAAFGMLLPLLKKRRMQIICILVILISWPYAFLQGSRNVTLAVFVPMIFSYLIFSKISPVWKVFLLISSWIFIERAMRLIVTFRNFGFDTVQNLQDKGHAGLNMASELTYCIGFIRTGILNQTFGVGILQELGNIIPRAIWADKPLIGIDYAIARGFSGGSGDIGVVATISTGMIGQGVLEFGFIFGPIFSAALMGLWCAFLARLWAQGTILRACLFLFGIGLTFNLGRNITMFVLWPMALAYILVIIAEYFSRHRAARPDFRASSVGLTG